MSNVITETKKEELEAVGGKLRELAKGFEDVYNLLDQVIDALDDLINNDLQEKEIAAVKAEILKRLESL